MASGNYADKTASRTSPEVSTVIPARARRMLPATTSIKNRVTEPTTETITFSDDVPSTHPVSQTTSTGHAGQGRRMPRAKETQTALSGIVTMPHTTTETGAIPRSRPTTRNVDVHKALNTDTDIAAIQLPHPFKRRSPWLTPWVICVVFAVIALMVLVSVGMYQRGDTMNLSYGGGQVYSIQVGGSASANTWPINEPAPLQKAIPTNPGAYSVLGKPTLSAAFINKVLAAYNSPAAGKGQALYDLGVKYDIDPAFALAFFMHESRFGTRGEAQTTLSLGNLRCIPNHPCVDQDRGGYAQFSSWEDGFQSWYELIRNLYVAQWGKTTIEQIIPTYAPTADNNDEIAYIDSLKHEIDTWHAGQVSVS